MRGLVGVILTALGLLVLGGPVFGAVGWLAGTDVSASGGHSRVIFDLVVGAGIVAIGARELRTTSSTAK